MSDSTDSLEYRRVRSALGVFGEGRCKYACAYCFAMETSYEPGPSVLSTDVLDALVNDDSDVLMISADTELLQNPTHAMKILDRLAQSGKHLTFSTKMILGRVRLKQLSDIQKRLRDKDRVLCVMVSLPLLASSRELEAGVPSPHRRIDFVKTLRASGLLPFVGIRPLLPPPYLTDDEILEIIVSTATDSYGYIIGPYWFREDPLGLRQMNLPVVERPVEWMHDNPVWSVYEDLEREQRVCDMIEGAGSRLFERSSDAVRRIARHLIDGAPL